MKLQVSLIAMGIGWLALAQPMIAQPVGTAFTYQGQLKQNGQPVNGNASMEFRLFDAATAGTQFGPTNTIASQSVANGLFTSTLDFGPEPFATGQARWLEIRVNGSTLTPRQSFAAAPMSLSTRGINVDAMGRVGIGTSSPQHLLHVAAPVGGEASGIRFEVPSLANVRLFPGSAVPKDSGFLTFGDGTGWRFHFGRASDFGATKFLTILDNGNIGIGVPQPTSPLHLGGPINVQSEHATIQLSDSISNIQFRMDGGGRMELLNGAGTPQIHFRQDGSVGIGTTNPQAKLDVAGTVRMQVAQITGADLAEKFPTTEVVTSGMVVAIDPASPGKLCLARGEYNKCVAGVVSGAGDLPAGAILGNLPGSDDHPPIALSGRVHVWADASNGPIEPGDLLTTSATAGHAMKAADPARSLGTIIGKAMTGLRDGRGLVLVLVNLQ